MFSAAKVVVAGAIVALFGGFLLAGVLTQQPSDDRPPVVGASASPGNLDPEATAPSVFAIKVASRSGPNGWWEQSYTADPDTGHITITGLHDPHAGPEGTTEALRTEPADAEDLYGIDVSDVDPRALGTLTVVLAKGEEMITDDDTFGVWRERSSIRLENDDGAWAGTASTQVLGVGVALGWATWELAGEGGYEGLTMFLHGDGRINGEPWGTPEVLVGVIVPSGSVPTIPPPADGEAE
jgi:hypothetical protein